MTALAIEDANGVRLATTIAPGDILTIGAIRYAEELFRQFDAELPLFTPFMLTAREDGVICIEKIDPERFFKAAE